MNEDEHIVEGYLKSQGYKHVIYEPDGNQPPDFLINGNIACEARRLNQFHMQNGRYVPLENLEYPLYQKLNQIFSSFKDSSLPNSAFVGYSIRRPFKLNKTTVKEIEAVCREQMNHITSRREYTIADNLYLTFIPSEKLEKQIYLFGSMLDYNKGGFIISETIKSLNFIISEKDRKVEPYSSRYDEWWLILVNHIFFDIDRLENDQIKHGMNRPERFSQIHIISPIERGKGYMVYKS